MPINYQVLAFNIALFLFNFAMLQVIIQKIAEYKKISKQLGPNPQQVLKNAEKSALKIISDAMDHADQIKSTIRKKVDQVNQNQDKNLKKALEKVEQENIKSLDQLSVKLNENTNRLLNNISLKGDKKVEEIFDNLNDKTENTYKEISLKLNKEYENTLNQIKKYKQEKQKEIDEKAEKLLKNVVKKAIPMLLNNEDHEKLILDSIKQAKKDNIF